VGAHQAHLQAGLSAHQVGCAECHVVPSSVQWDPSTPSHMNGVNDIQWGPLAQMGTYDPETHTCSGSYCHGATLGPDAVGTVSNRVPKWTVVDGSQAKCGESCHSLPPGGSHVPGIDCAGCHGDVVRAVKPGTPFEVTWENPSLHIDGKVQFGGKGCTSCHGDPTTGRISPPKGTGGEVETSQAAVGAHEIHLASSAWHRRGLCTDCHASPSPSSHPNGVVEFGWDGPSGANGAKPAYDASNVTCSGVYCHGSTLAGPTSGGTVKKSPVWNVVDGTYKECGTTCHTLPPGGSHPPVIHCQNCHTGTLTHIDVGNPLDAVWNDPAMHIDGKVDF
jgi:predicted CxxxxCH...CXXCH cytochrome family protein